MSSCQTVVVRSASELQAGDHISWLTPLSSVGGTVGTVPRHHAIVVAWQGGNEVKLIHVIIAGLRDSVVQSALSADAACGTGMASAVANAQVVENVQKLKNLADGTVYKYVYTPGSCSEPFEVIQNARSKIGSFPFDIHNNNCGHFARWCKYGNIISYRTVRGSDVTSCVCM